MSCDQTFTTTCSCGIVMEKCPGFEKSTTKRVLFTPVFYSGLPRSLLWGGRDRSGIILTFVLLLLSSNFSLVLNWSFSRPVEIGRSSV